nr:MAG TPA: major tropism determinant [Caudoviricetes sp.]
MAIQFQIRRGTTAQNSEFVGALGGITMDTDTNGLRIHDGNAAGGYIIDTIVAFQPPTEENGYTWYRRYSSGWVEQGGFEVLTGLKEKQITFPVIMRDNHYTPSVTAGWASASSGQNEGCENLQTTGMRLTASYEGVTLWWQVCGMVAA